MLVVGGVVRIYLDHGVRLPRKDCSLKHIVNKEMLVVDGVSGGKTTHPATHSPTNQRSPIGTHPPTMQGLFADVHPLTVTAILRIMVK